MGRHEYGKVLAGNESSLRCAYKQWEEQAVDQEWVPSAPEDDIGIGSETTLKDKCSVTGPGTFLGKAQRTLTFEPTNKKGWWFDRTDQPGELPIHVSVTTLPPAASMILVNPI